MKMAKLQKATLDPAKISGYCGRLKCCLRYEDHTYRELSRRLPRKRTRVKTSHGEGIVVNTQILTQLVSIKSDDGKVFAVPVEEIEILELPSRQPDREKPDKSTEEQVSEESNFDDFDDENTEEEDLQIDPDNRTEGQNKPEQ
jgi:cell fate regulator YaaT (PSP1 superfamily)